jgi:hypothetical protein
VFPLTCGNEKVDLIKEQSGVVGSLNQGRVWGVGWKVTIKHLPIVKGKEPGLVFYSTVR